jgi:hypothetical protein
MMNDETAAGLREEGPSTLDQTTRSANAIGQQARKRIGSHLRAMYDGMVQQPVPSRFTDLIARLDDRTGEPASDEA